MGLDMVARISFVLFTLAFLTNSARSQSVPEESEVRDESISLVSSVLEAFQSNRQKLVGAEFAVEYESHARTTRADGVQETKDVSISGDCIFSDAIDSRVMRYTSTENVGGEDIRTAVPLPKQTRQFISAITPGSFQFVELSNRRPVLIISKDRGSAKLPPPGVHGTMKPCGPIDPRAVGLCPLGLTILDGVGFLECLDRFYKAGDSNVFEQAMATESDAGVTLTQVYQSGHLRCEIVFDGTPEMLPIVHRILQIRTTEDGVLETEPILESTVRWKTHDGIKVPVSVEQKRSMHSSPTGSNGKQVQPTDYTQETSQMNIKWRSVNKPINQARFQHAGFDLPKDSKIVDVRRW
tara:strand:- start:259788 stop:260843 length:1056 start_codon:yes stop_codon:yes gene_type:complete